MNPNRRTTAIIGGIGCGKSTVSEILRELGYQVLDCDQIAREIADDGKIIQQVSDTFGEEFITDGKLNRKYMRQVILADSAKTEQLNAIFHRRVRDELVDRIKSSDTSIFVEVSVPKGLPREMFTDVWQVTASKRVRIKRVVFRDNTPVEDVENIIRRQQENFNYRPTAILDNSGYIDDLKKQILHLLKQRHNTKE